jgi:hypothetical protein
LFEQSNSCCILFVFLAIIMLLGHQRIIKPGCAESTVSVWVSSLIGRCNHRSSVYPGGLQWAQGCCCERKQAENHRLYESISEHNCPQYLKSEEFHVHARVQKSKSL